MNHPGTQARARAQQQFENLLNEIDEDWNAQCDLARNHISETLNQGLRRIRQAESLEDAATLAVEIVTPFASRCAIFLFGDGRAAAIAARGLGPVPLDFSPDEGAAFRTCIETRDPVIAIGTESEISRNLAERVGADLTDRVHLLPIVIRGEVKCILFAAGSVQSAPLELITGITAIQIESLGGTPRPKREDLVAIHGVSPARTSTTVTSIPPSSWADLTPGLQALHLRAQRDARLRVAEIRLQHGAALRDGLNRSDLYSALREPIDAARESFRRDFLSASPTMVDYLYLEIVRGLAQDDDRLLGSKFPGALI